jgi:hypothetical protein
MLRQLGPAFSSYDELVALIRRRLAELSATCESASDLAGLSTTHLSKIVCAERPRILGRMSFGCVLGALGIELVPMVDDVAYAALGSRLPRAKFNRWPEGRHETMINSNDVGGPAAIARVPLLLAAVMKPKPAPVKPAKPPRPVFDPAERHPLPERRRMQWGKGRRKQAA